MLPRHDRFKEPPEEPRELVSRTIRSEELVEGATVTPATHTHVESDITPGGAATSDHGHAITQDVFLLPTQDAHDTILDDWPHNTAGTANEVAFIWHVPAEWTGFNTVSVVMIPDTEETIQADIDVSVATAGEAHDGDTRQSLDETLAIGAGDVDAITEWPLLAVGSLFGGIEPDDVIAIRFQSDTDTMRILGLHINYGIGAAAGDSGGSGGASAHGDLSGVTASQHHNESHAPESHTGQGATAAELEALTDTSDADSLHGHSNHGVSHVTDDHAQSHNVASHSDTTATGTELETLTDGSETSLHSHAGGSGSLTTIKENDVQVGGADIEILDFLGADFDLTESPDKEIQIVIAAAIARSADVVTKVLFDAHTILAAVDNDDPFALTIPASRIVGRKSSGNIGALTGAEILAILSGQAAANFAMNSKKFTGLAAGSGAGDSVRYEQLVAAASTTVAGKVELATTAEIDAATPARAVTTDALGDSNYSERILGFLISDPGGDALTTGNTKAMVRIPSSMTGFELVEANACLTTVSSSGPVTIQVAKSSRTNATTRTASVNMLSTPITIDVSEFDSLDAATEVIQTDGKEDVVTGDQIRIDIDAAGTDAKGLFVELIFRLK